MSCDAMVIEERPRAWKVARVARALWELWRWPGRPGRESAGGGAKGGDGAGVIGDDEGGREGEGWTRGWAEEGGDRVVGQGAEEGAGGGLRQG